MNILDDFERICPRCNGTGKHKDDKIFVFPHCSECNGQKTVKTSKGIALTEFIERHITTSEGRIIIKKGQ